METESDGKNTETKKNMAEVNTSHLTEIEKILAEEWNQKLESEKRRKLRQSEQHKRWKEQWHLILADIIPPLTEEEKSPFEADGKTYKLGVPLFEGDPPIRLDDFSLARVANKKRRLDQYWARLSSSSSSSSRALDSSP